MKLGFVAALAVGIGQPLWAQDLSLGDAPLAVVDTPDFMQAVMYKGEKLLEDGLIDFDPAQPLQAQDVIVGTASAGGNACPGTPFVVSLAAGKAVLAGPIPSCALFDVQLAGAGLSFAEAAVPGHPGERWQWQRDSGLVQQPSQEFAPDPRQTWADFAQLGNLHPIDMLSFTPVWHELSQAMPADQFAALAETLYDIGSGEMLAEGYAGNACAKMDCEAVWGYLWVDRESQKVMALWRGIEDADPIAFPPDQTAWPQWVRDDMATRL